MIKTIFFDIGGVLIDIHPERTYQYLSDSADVEVSMVKESFPWDAHDQYERGIMNNEDWFITYKESLPQPCCLKRSDFWNAWKLLLGEEKNTVNILEALNKQYSIWLLSNTNPKHIQDEIEKRYLFPSLVNGAVYSFDVGVRKPEKEIYEIAMQRANANPQECLFIDDLLENIQAAKQIGIEGIHFISSEQLKQELVHLGIINEY
jgi:FMN phosphatase YigB (HAD superfamily)|tara:strand:+ start:2378 stop:2992 length:615 start_codon:yes stop_codon:yes gene_type:complete